MNLPTADLDEKSKAELVQFVENEQRRANFQSTVHQYTDTCWDKCIMKVKPALEKSDEGWLKKFGIENDAEGLAH
ncbi:Mitochondrial import inner membrane translocase subunit tim8 [Thoreauomyces humboldtii]|nr:Mitochondrial import inner membrane translocase subunit tim8 [Thoreauomyces humboldtii]